MLVENLERVLRTVPAVAQLGISVVEAHSGHVVLAAPDTAANLNADGRVHTSVLFSVGELAAMVALGTHPRLAALVRLQKSCRIDYLAVPAGAVSASAAVTGAMLEAIDSGLAADGRVAVEVPVRVVDAAGTLVAELISLFTVRR
jgi:acyl-coenzyme A thioesterase PaaI-like protein